MTTSFAVPILAAGLLGVSTVAATEIRTCQVDGPNRAIAETYDAHWRAAISAGDTDAVSTLYAESAVLMPPSDETLVGRGPVSEYLADAEVPAQTENYSVDLVSCERRGNALHVAGVWGLPGRNVDGSGTWLSGNLLRVLEPDADGRWVSSFEIWN